MRAAPLVLIGFITGTLAFVPLRNGPNANTNMVSTRPIRNRIVLGAMNDFMSERLSAIRRTFNELTERLGDPDVTSNSKVTISLKRRFYFC